MEKKIYLEPMANFPWDVLDFIYPRGPAGGAQVVSASPELVGKQVAVSVLEAYDSGIICDGVLVWYLGTVTDITDYDIVLKDAESPALCGAEDTTVAFELGKIQRLLVKEDKEGGKKEDG